MQLEANMNYLHKIKTIFVSQELEQTRKQVEVMYTGTDRLRTEYQRLCAGTRDLLATLRQHSPIYILWYIIYICICFSGARGQSWRWQWTSNNVTETQRARTKSTFLTKFAFPRKWYRSTSVMYYIKWSCLLFQLLIHIEGGLGFQILIWFCTCLQLVWRE